MARLDTRLLALERCEVALEAHAAVVHLGQRTALVGAGGCELVARAHELVLDGGDLVALAQYPFGRELFALLEVRELDRLVVRAVAKTAHSVGDLAVLIRDPVEELGALEQVAKAVRRQDHGERVGRVGLVDLDQAGREHPARGHELAAQPLEPVARRLQAVAHGEQLLLLLVEAVLHPRQAALGSGDLALDRVDAGVEALDRGAEHALLRLVVLDLVALLLDAGRQRGREAGKRQHEEGHDGH